MAKLLKLIKEKFAFWGIAFLLFFIPLYPKFPLLSVNGTYVSVRLEDFFVAALVLLYFGDLFLRRDFSILKDKLTKLIALYFGIGLLSVLNSYFITKNIVLHIALLHFVRRVEYLSLFFIAYSSFKNINQLKIFGRVILISTLGVIVYAVGQKFFSWPVVSTMNKEFSKGMILRLTWWARVNSTFAGHYDLAAYMVMILPLTVAALIIFRQWWIKIIASLFGILSYYILLLTASRISFAAYIASMLVVLWVSRKRWWVIPFLIFSISGMIFSADLGQRYMATFKVDLSFLSGMVKIKPPPEIALAPSPTAVPTPFVPAPTITKPGFKPSPTATLTPTPTPEVATPSAEYFESTELAVGRSTDIRFKVEWPRAVRAFLKNPLLGTGYSSITLATDNDYLRILGETGLLGTLAFALVIFEIFRRIIFFLKETSAGKTEKTIVLGILGASIGYFINAGFIDVWEASKVAFFFWIMMGAGLKVIDLENSNIKDQISKPV